MVASFNIYLEGAIVMTDNHKLYLPGSELDGLTIKQAQAKANRAAAQQQPDCSASDQAKDQGRNQTRSAAGKSQRNQSHRASGKGKRNQRAAKGKHTVFSALVRVQVFQLLAVLGAIVAFYLAFQFGWI
jgi:hypothetical protein